MSNRKHFDAKYKDSKGHEFFGPFFPTAFDRIQAKSPEKPQCFSAMLYDDIADKLRGGRVTYLPMTSDVSKRIHSPWSCAVGFERHGRRYVVLMPKLEDSKLEDGTPTTRHVALYVWCNEQPDDAEIALVAEEFASDFVEIFESRYG